MKIYLDLIFILNFSFDFLLLLATSLLTKGNKNLKRIFLGALVGSSSILFLFLPLSSFLLFILKIVISILMILVSFGYKKRELFIKNIMNLYILSILLGGILYFLNIQFSYKQSGLVFFHEGLGVNVLFLIVASPIILFLIIKKRKEEKIKFTVEHEVDIYITDYKKITLKGYLDTGNKLYDPYFHKPILITSNKNIFSHFKGEILVPYQTLHSSGVIHCRKIKKIVIDSSIVLSNVLVGFSNDMFHLGEAEVILHPDFFV